MWIFGYGSLVWKADFPYTEKLVGYIKGYDRRFWQASIDHRGTPEKPGRVVTLVPSIDPEARVWGAAYKIEDSKQEEVLRHLDHREVMGYEKVPILFHPIINHPLNQVPVIDGSAGSDLMPFEVTMYYGSSHNEHYSGEAPIDVIAKRISECVGPSGRNKDYLLNLVNAMKQLKALLPESARKECLIEKDDILDSHLLQLESVVMKLESQNVKSNINNGIQ